MTRRTIAVPNRRVSWMLAAGAAAWPLMAAPAGAQPQGDGPAKVTVLALEWASMDRWVVDPRDRALADAVGMIPARVRELPREIPNMPPPAAGLLNLVLTTVPRPGSLVVTYDRDNPEEVAFGYGVALGFDMPEEDARRTHAQVSAMLASAGPGAPVSASERFAGMTELATPIGPVCFGPRRGAGGWRYEVLVGHVTDPDSGREALPKADAGVTPTFRGRFDFAGLTPVMSLVESFAGDDPGARFMIEGTREAGMWGPEALKVSVVGGFAADRCVMTTVMHGAKRFAEAWHTSVEPLAPADIAVVPADSVWAGVGRGDLVWLQELIDHVIEAQPEAAEGFEKFAQQTGVNLRDDVLGALGGTLAFYTSDSTGGGSLASGVVLVSFKDRARFLEAHTKLAAFAGAMADQLPIGPGRVRITAWKDGPTELFSVRCPGLPVPLEPTWAATDRWLIVGATPQAAIAAARQAAGRGDKGLASNPGVAAMMPRDRPLISLSYMDTARMLRDGYPILSLLGSGLANAVRSPIVPEREPGLIVPPYRDLAVGVKPTLELTYWRGEDLVQESLGDRSWLVNIGAGAGVIREIAPLIAIPMMAGAAQRGRFGMLDEDRLPRTALAVLLSPRTPTVVRRHALGVLLGVAAHERVTPAR